MFTLINRLEVTAEYFLRSSPFGPPSSSCFSGTLVTLPPPSMKTFDISDSGVKIDVVAIEWPANATALIYEDGALVCRTTDPDESKEGAETSEVRIKCKPDQVIGDIDKLVLPEGMQTVGFSGCTGLTGRAES